jgi:hypothetical protein
MVPGTCTCCGNSIKLSKAIKFFKMTFDQLFTKWIQKIIRTENPGKELIAYKFGIFETPDISSGYYIYLIGTKTYSKKNDDWASGMGDYTPRDTYLGLPEKEFKDKEWEEVQDVIENKIREFIKTDDFKNSFFNSAKVIAVGSDGADLIRIK